MTASRVFLMFHELELPGRPMCQADPGYARYVISAEEFREQVDWLRNAGWRGVNVSQAFSDTNARAVIVTFDDGCETDLLAAAPLLQQAGFAATSYITAGFIGKPGYLSPNQVRELSQSSFEIGCHSMSHPYLSDLSASQLEDEIRTPKDRLEQMIGKSVDHFSCPGGRWNARVVTAVQEAGYKTMATSRTVANTPSTDHFNLGRVAITRGLPLSEFQAICDGSKLWQLSARERLTGAAKRLLGNSLYDRVRSTLMR